MHSRTAGGDVSSQLRKRRSLQSGNGLGMCWSLYHVLAMYVRTTYVHGRRGHTHLLSTPSTHRRVLQTSSVPPLTPPPNPSPSHPSPTDCPAAGEGPNASGNAEGGSHLSHVRGTQTRAPHQQPLGSIPGRAGAGTRHGGRGTRRGGKLEGDDS